MKDKTGSGSQIKNSTPYYDCEHEIFESPLKGENLEEYDDEDTLPFEDTVLLENTVPLENTVVLENGVTLETQLETQLVGDDKNQEERSLLPRKSDRDIDAEDTVCVDDLQGDTEAKTQLYFELDNAISNIRNEAHLHIVADSDNEDGGETEILSEGDDGSDCRSSPQRVDGLKNNQFLVEAVPYPNNCHAKEIPQTQSYNTEKGSSFNTVDSHRELQQKSVVDSDASTEDESDLGSFPSKSSQSKKQPDDRRVLLEDSDPAKKNDSHKPTSCLLSDGFNNPEAIQSVSASSQVRMPPTSAEITRGNSPNLSSDSVSRCRNIASVRAASLRASGLRASEMLSKRMEITGVQGAKSESCGKYDSAALLIAAMSDTVQAMKNNPVLPSDPKSKTESLTARRLFPDIESMEIDKMKARDGSELDDKPRAKNGSEKDDAPRAMCGNKDEQMAMVGNKEDDKPITIVVNKEDGGSSEQFKNEKDDILRKQASDSVNLKQLESIGLQKLGNGKKTQPYAVSAGLSYLDSQEPGEQSQADALNMVDKFVWLNTTGYSQDQEPQKLAAMTFSGPPSASGPQHLAQFVESKGPNENIGVFDWVDGDNDEAEGQFFSKNNQGVLASKNKGGKVKPESKQLGRRSYKRKNGSPVLHKETEKIGMDKSKILLQGLQKVAGSGASKSILKEASDLSHGRQSQVKVVKDQQANVTISNRTSKSQFSVDTLRFSERLRQGKEQTHDRKKTDASDKKNSIVENLPLNSGEASDQQAREKSTCNDSLDLSNIGNDTQMAAEAMQIMHSEAFPNQVTEEKTCIVAKRDRTKLGESRKRNSRVSGAGIHKVPENHTSRKRALTDTIHGSSENCAKQRKTTRSYVASVEIGRRVHWAEDGEKLQEDEGRKPGKPRKSKQDEKKKLESKTDPTDSEVGKENEDMVKESMKVPIRKDSNMEETVKPAGEVQSAGANGRVGCFTRQASKLNQGQLRETETSCKSSGADEKGDILEDSAKVIKRKRKLATENLTKSARVQSVGEAKEEMQPNVGTPVIHSTRRINRKNVENHKPETRSDSKTPTTEEENKDVSKNAAKITRNKRNQANVEDTSYEQNNSMITWLPKSKPTIEVKSTGADAEVTMLRAGKVAVTPSPQVKNLLQVENLKLDKQTVSTGPENHDESRNMSPDLMKAVRRKRSKTNREKNKWSKYISAAEGSHADTADRDMQQKVAETALRITRQSMRNSGPESGSVSSALTAVDGDKYDLINMVPESGAHGQKSRRKNTTQTTPSGSKLANNGTLVSSNKDEVHLNDTSVDVRSPFTYEPPENVNFKSPITIARGRKATQSSWKEPLKKGTPNSTLKRELGRLVTPESGQSPILKDSVRKRREPGSIHVLFSHSLDDDLAKQQKKILTKLGGQPTASAEDCTHFVTDKFVRTRNMLEAMAAGKLVVTHLWLQNCGQASYFIDEKKYILRDEKKEKEIGFSMPASLASAQQKPLLQGKRVFVTPSTKPEQESIISMVKAADGQVLNTLKGALSKKEENMESIIIISCEEDYGVCIPLLEKGARIYSPEFLLNGIVLQRLDFS
ncbi:hypothetical protein KI387_001317, partial [Taxus chinensis]